MYATESLLRALMFGGSRNFCLIACKYLPCYVPVIFTLCLGRTYLAAGLSKQALPTLVSKLWCYACLVHSPESWGLSTSSLAEWIYFFALSFILAPASHVWSAYFVLRRVRAHYWRARGTLSSVYVLPSLIRLIGPSSEFRRRIFSLHTFEYSKGPYEGKII